MALKSLIKTMPPEASSIDLKTGLMIGAFVISFVSIIGTGISLWFSHRSDKRSAETHQRSIDADERSIKSKQEKNYYERLYYRPTGHVFFEAYVFQKENTRNVYSLLFVLN